MRELNKTKVYSLKDLTSEQKQQLLEKLRELDDPWVGGAPRLQLFSSKYLHYTNSYNSLGGWFVSDEIYYKNKEIVNAKELFYTLDNVQVDCRYLTNDQIDEIADVFKKYGYRIGSLFLMEEYCFIRENAGKYCLVTTKDKNKTKITYDKFIELFSEPQYEVTEKPKHYSKGIDTFARMEANCTKEECLAFAKGNIDKYNFRTKGQDLEDYKKIVSYANWAIKLLKDEK